MFRRMYVRKSVSNLLVVSIITISDAIQIQIFLLP